MSTPPNANPEASSVAPEPAPVRAQVGPRLRWLLAGATVLSLGVGAAWLAQPIDPTRAIAQANAAIAEPLDATTPAAFEEFDRETSAAPLAGPEWQRGALRLGVVVEPGQNGLLVKRVLPQGPAGKAGLLPGDVITAINGQPVTTVAAVRQALQNAKPGDTAQIGYTRNAQPATTTATLTNPPAMTQRPGVPRPGAGGPPDFGALRGVPPQNRFKHMLGSQTTVLDAQGNRVTIQSLPGVVVAVGPTSITIQPNDPTKGQTTYTIDANTRVPGGPPLSRPGGPGQPPPTQPGQPPPSPPGQPGQPLPPPPGGQGAQAGVSRLKPGDPVIVVSELNQTVAKAILGAGRHRGPKR